MRAHNDSRVIFYGRNNWAAGHFRGRVIELLLDPNDTKVESINDAIEAYQCKRTVEELPEIFDEDANALLRASKELFSKACKYTNLAIVQSSVESLYEETELQYAHLFWELLDKTGAAARIPDGAIGSFAGNHPERLANMLSVKTIVSEHGKGLRDSLVDNPIVAGELLIRTLAVDDSRQPTLFLPEELTSGDIDVIMQEYLRSDQANLNYVRVLTTWPRSVERYKPSADTQVLAQKTEKRALDELARHGVGLRYGTMVGISEEQRACVGLEVEGLEVRYIYSGQWLKTHLDPATILNNCIYLFEFVDARGLMPMPAHKHDPLALLERLRVRVRNEYSVTQAFHSKNLAALTKAIAYNDFLNRNGTSLEEALEWAINVYFESEFGIKGFSISLSSPEASWLEKCKAIGPEIERVMKAHSLLCERGEIDGAFFPFESAKYFSDLPTLISNKYVIAGERFDSTASWLFSDQSELFYTQQQSDDAHNFFDLIRRGEIARSDYGEQLRRVVEGLLEEELITTSDSADHLKPTKKALLLKGVWGNGAIALRLSDSSTAEAVSSLIDDRLLIYHDALFTPDESDYLNYVFNDAMFSNSLGLRNRWLHANAAVVDPNADSIKLDYHQLLIVLLVLTIKVNEELQCKTGKGGLGELVDWPFYDESVLRSAEQLRIIPPQDAGQPVKSK